MRDDIFWKLLLVYQEYKSREVWVGERQGQWGRLLKDLEAIASRLNSNLKARGAFYTIRFMFYLWTLLV